MPIRDHSFRRALDAAREDRGLVSGLRSAEALAHEAGRVSDHDDCLELLLDDVDQSEDQLLSIAAVHAISALPGRGAAEVLTELLVADEWHVAEHAAWALSARSSHGPAMAPLADIVAGGGFAGMLAQRTLGGWASNDGAGVGRAVAELLDVSPSPGARRRLVETLGLVPDASVTVLLECVARDTNEGPLVRRAAVGALGERGGAIDVLVGLSDGDDDADGDLAVHATLALMDRSTLDVRTPGRPGPGLRVAQLFLHADLGAGRSRAGAGDNGGVATLLWLLSAELAAHDDIHEVVTIGRGPASDALDGSWSVTGAGERAASVAYGPPGGTDMRGAWPYRVEIERGLRRVLRSCGHIDAIHLRMADVGTMAASRVARQLDIPVVFTAAPDPHGVLRSLEAGGTLGRADFGDSDALEHWWFRARMVERITAQADRIALLPRPGMRDDLHDLLGHDTEDGRSTVIPEGVHAATVRDAAAAVAAARSPRPLGAAVTGLAAALDELPASRRGLSLAVTVGRLHPSKGIDRIVQAWVGDDELRTGTNLVIVGGDVEAPTPDELDVLATIEGILAGAAPGSSDGVVLLGHRPHDEVARLLAVAAHGVGALADGGITGGGIYVGGARKEEFGLAIVEALAAGLPVVAPAGGGPATYVDDGLTGVLVDTMSVPALADGMRRALALSPVPGRAAAATADVLGHLTIERMAERLVALYRSAVRIPT
ncbi:MAG: glycosyltransferase [Ilumatobacteraceae bacterium]